MQPKSAQLNSAEGSQIHRDAAEPIRTALLEPAVQCPPAARAAPAAAGAERPAPPEGPGSQRGVIVGEAGIRRSRSSVQSLRGGLRVSRVMGGDRGAERCPDCLAPGLTEPIPVQLQCCSILPPCLPRKELFPLLGIFQGPQSYSLAPSQRFP